MEHLYYDFFCVDLSRLRRSLEFFIHIAFSTYKKLCFLYVENAICMKNGNINNDEEWKHK